LRAIESLQIVNKLRQEFSFFKGNYLVLVVSWIFMDFAGEIPGAYYPLYVKDLGGNEAIIGFIGFIAFLCIAAVQFPGGYLADKYGRRWLISTMTFGVALSYIFYALAPSWEFIMLGVMAQNLCLIYQPALFSMISDSLPPEKRGMGISITQLIASVSTTPGPAVAAFLYTLYGSILGMRISYGIVVALFLFAAVLRSNLKETIKDPPKISLREILKVYPASLRESFKVWKIVPRSTFYLFLSFLVGGFSFAMIQLFTVIYAVEDLGLSRPEWSLVLMVLFIAMIVLSIPVGKLIDKVGRKIPLLLSYLFMLPSILLFIYGDLYRLPISLVLMGLVQLMMFSSYSALMADLVPKEQRGKVTGFSQFFNYITMALGVLIGGIIYTTVSHQLPFFLVVVFLVPQFLVTFFLVHEPKQREQ
jgi:MFS family permease